jgi:hypothetical protein
MTFLKSCPEAYILMAQRETHTLIWKSKSDLWMCGEVCVYQCVYIVYITCVYDMYALCVYHVYVYYVCHMCISCVCIT